MKNKYLIRVLSIALCCVMLLSCLGCDKENKQEAKDGQNKKTELNKPEPMENEQVDTYSFDFIGGRDVMPITGFNGPMPSEYSVNGVAIPDYITDEIFQSLADCGINFLQHTYTDYKQAPTLVKKMMELGEKYHIGITVNDSYILSMLGENALSLKEVDERINEYMDFPAFCGLYVADELNSDTFYPQFKRPISDYEPIFSNLSDLDVWAYGNMLPCYLPDKRKEYSDYLDEFISTCDLKVLQWDFYVFDKGHEKTDYFYNLSIGREKAAEYNIPFWTYIQAGSQWNDALGRFDTAGYYPTEGEFTWNVNTCLAYGAKGISYFPIIQPYYFAYAESQPYDFERNSLIGTAGNKNRWWYYAKNANRQIAAVDEVLMNSVSKGVIVTGDKAKKDNVDSSCIMEGDSWRELVGIQGETLTGCFNYQGKSAYYVVNYDTEYAQKITLDFYEECNFTVVQNAESSKLKGEGITLTMKPGEGVLIVME